MITQIYTVQSVVEALEIARLGVDRIGVTPSKRGLPGEIDNGLAREIIEALKGKVTRVALSVEERIEDIVGMVAAVCPDVLHLCGDIGIVSPAVVRTLRRALEAEGLHVEILQAIPMTGPEALAHAEAFEPIVDSFILDSVAPNIDGIGAAGVTHDWKLSRIIVERSKRPVILAGGLSVENVVDAIRAVRPWGVDSLTRTNRALPEGGFRKDIAKVRAFVAAARSAALAG